MLGGRVLLVDLGRRRLVLGEHAQHVLAVLGEPGEGAHARGDAWPMSA